LHTIHVTHPSLDYWIDLRVRDFNCRWLAVCEGLDEFFIGLGETAAQALWEALQPFDFTGLRAELAEEAARKLLRASRDRGDLAE
jgi:hypothetical protein